MEHNNTKYWKWKNIIGRIQGTKEVLPVIPVPC